jgi:hypothetical protein
MATVHERAKFVIDEVGKLMAENLRFRYSVSEEDQWAVRSMWSILSALRGPDNEDTVLKDKTTAKIRSAIGIPDNYVVTVNSSPIRPGDDPPTSDHFNLHILHAFHALRYFGYIEDASPKQTEGL